ncbi:MAG: hypothetical protein JWQ98_1273 [Chlorobi bacterium]|nr:hypothetical protein [Chlorobiota bacterium]
MADIHVFADIDQIRGQDDNNPMQTIDEAYGPTRTNVNDRYRLTSRFKFDDEAVAYAMFDGIAIVQDVPDPNFPGLVNLALYNIGISRRFPNPKVVIYRGLVRDDFFRDTGIESKMQIANRPGFNSDLIVNMWQHFDDWKNKILPIGQTTSLVEPPYDMVGYMNYDPNGHELDSDGREIKRKEYGDDDDVIGWFLRHSTGLNYYPFPIKKGWTIGRFKRYTELHQVGGGIDILLQEESHGLTFGVMRKFQNTVEFTQPSTGVAGAEDVDKMRSRERVLDYIDPAAFYNHFRDSGVDYKAETIIGDAVYDRIVSKFYTKNRIYVEIRNQSDNSLNMGLDNMDETTMTDHFKIGFNGAPGSELPANYYVNFWPIYYTELSTASGDMNTMQIAFRKKYNPVPVIYMDQAMSVKEVGSERFIRDFAAESAIWSNTFQFLTPNLPRLVNDHGAGAKTGTAWMTRIYLIRKKLPAIQLPARTIPSDNYADLIFGPVVNLSSFYPAGNNSKWILGGAKRYVNGDVEFGGKGDFMVLTGKYIDQSSIVFFATLLDKNGRITPMPVVSTRPIQAVDYGPLSGQFFEAIKSWSSQFDKFKNFPILPMGGTKKELPTYQREYEYFPEYGMLTLRVSHSEYDVHLLPAVALFDPSLLPIYFSLDSFQHAKDQNGKYFHQAQLMLSGLNNSSVYTREFPMNGNVIVRSVDRFNFTSDNSVVGEGLIEATTDPKAYFVANSSDKANLIAFVEAIEDTYADWDLRPEDTVSRFRQEYYGSNYRASAQGATKEHIMAIGKGLLFQISIPADNNLEADGITPRILIRWRARVASPDKVDLVRRYEDAIDHLWALADENSFRDNPSPLVQDPEHAGSLPRYRWDLGHATYGLMALINNGLIDYPYTKGFGIDNSIDLASYVGDLGGVPADYFGHIVNGAPPSGRAEFPETPDRDRYWEIEAPDNDLIGDAESFGWWRAWKSVRDDAAAAHDTFKFSDVLKHYYNPNVVTNAHYTKRWHIFCEDNGYIDATGNWLITGPTHPVYQQLVGRVRRSGVLLACVAYETRATGIYLLNSKKILDSPAEKYLRPPVEKYSAVLTDTEIVYYTIDRWLNKVQGWLAAE